jgi:5'-3' exonuclease
MVDPAIPRAYLIDASMYVFRAWHAMPDVFFDVDGASVNAVHGFARFLLEFLERTHATHAATAFDLAHDTSFRNALYPAYKANRPSAPPELIHQFECCRRVASTFGLAVLADATYEADDLIGSVQAAVHQHAWASVIVSADKDFGQLLGPNDEQWDYARDRRWSAATLPEKLGIEARQVVDYLALMGDASDNIPGVPGIGPKGAAALLAHFGDLETLLARADEVAFLHLRGAKTMAARLRAYGDQARLSQRLARIALDAPVPQSPDALARRAPDPAALDALFDQLRMGPVTREHAHKILFTVPAA